jgi:hypothetical protein
MRNWKKFHKDEKGVTMIMVAIALVMIFAFAVLAIDMSMIQLAKTQLQNAADAAALAGAKVLCDEGGDQDSARAEAIRIAGLNVAVQDIQRSVIISESDVTFPDSTRITVVTHRTKATGDPVSLYFMKVLGGENKGEMRARASATCGAKCLKPFSPPDRWYDANGDGNWNPADGDYYDPVTTGYMSQDDIGDTVILYLGDPNDPDFKMGWYYPIRYPGDQGADDYREGIKECCHHPTAIVHIGDRLEIEPGGMVGPTKQGLKDLIALDDGAYWDDLADSVAGSCCNSGCSGCCEGVSPRIIKCPAFDPTIGVEPGGGPGWVTVVKIIVVFLEDVDQQGNIIGRFIDVADENFVYNSSLVE